MCRLNDLAKADTLPRLEPCQQWRWGGNKEEDTHAEAGLAWQSIHHERVKSDDSTQSAWTDEEAGPAYRDRPCHGTALCNVGKCASPYLTPIRSKHSSSFPQKPSFLRAFGGLA